MAQEDSSRTFSTIAPSHLAHSPYASSYANLAENIGDEWIDSNKLKDVMAVAGFISQQDRAEKEAKRNAFYEDLRGRAEQRAQERADRYAAKQDYREHLMDQADQLIGKIEMIDPMHKNAKGALEDIRSSQNFGRLLANRDTRQAILDAFKNKAKEHEDIVGGFMQEGETKYGFKPSLNQIPVKEDGTFDTETFYTSALPSLAQEMQQKAQQTYETASKPGFVKYSESDEYGRPVAKFVKQEDLNKKKLEEVRLARGVQMQALGAMTALRQERENTLGGFKMKELENPTGYLAANGKPTKDPSQAATAVWRVKGKEVARMPEQDRQGKIQKLGVISSQIEDYGTMAFPKPTGETAPSAAPSAPSVAPSTQVEPTTFEAPVETTSQVTPSAQAPKFSPENPYAQQAVQEQQAAQAKTSKEQSQKKEKKRVAGWYKASEEEKVASEYLKNIPSTKSIPGELFDTEVSLTQTEKASLYEKTKAQLNQARAKRLYFEARDPDIVNVNLLTLKGDELDEFKRDYLGPALLEEAGNDPQKAFALAKERGYYSE
jgi:rRNA maturation protein Nop10